MATRTKTVEYAFAESTASVATAVARDFTQLAVLELPESGITFRSVILQCSAWDNGTATAASITAVLMGIALGAVARNDATVTFTLTNSGENQAWVWDRDVTSYFTTNWTGTSMTADCRLTVTGTTTLNATAKLIITYEYDDTSATQVKTVRIPIDGNTGNLTTSFTTVGTTTNQIPDLSTFLPESIANIRSYFFQMDVHSGTTAAAAATLDMRYDGATTVSTGSFGFGANSDMFLRWFNVLGSYGQNISTNAAHSIEAKTTSATGAPFPCLNGVIIVTYTFRLSTTTTLNGGIDASTTSVVCTDASGFPATPYTIQIDNEKMRVTSRTGNTLTVTRAYDGTSAAAHSDLAPVLPTILNSVMMTCIDEAGWQGGTASTDKGRFTRDISVQEPGFIDLKQSGVIQSLNDAGAPATILNCGSQSNRTFTHPASLHCGGMTHMRRVDSGAQGGAGMTLARGFNTLVLDYYATSATAGNIGSNTSGLLYLNYTSGQAAQGPGAHNHTTVWSIYPYTNQAGVQRFQFAPSIVPIIPEADYWLVAASYELLLDTYSTTSATGGMAFNCEVQSGEAEGAGWRNLYSSLYTSDNERGMSLAWARARTEFKRWPNDTDSSRLNVETARDYRFDYVVNAVMKFQCRFLMTYHTITKSIAGSITGSSGGTVQIAAYRTDTGEKIGSTSRTGNGAYSITWYDDTVDVFVEARESGTLIGRSDNGKAA